jgi:transcriptional regulator with XRE-family HTH domain
VPSELPKELMEARLRFGAALATARRDTKGWSLEDMRSALRETYGHPISRERLRQIERDGTYDPDNETVRLVAELLDITVPDGLKRPTAKKLPGGEGSPPRIALARAKKELLDHPDAPANKQQGMRLRIARIEKGFTQAGLTKAVNERLPDGLKPIRVGFVSEAERGVPSLPASALDVLTTLLDLREDVGLLVRDDAANPLVVLHDPLTTLLLASESWLAGRPLSPPVSQMVSRSVDQVRTALQGVSA